MNALDLLRISAIAFCALTIGSCKRDQLKMSVILYDNQNPGNSVSIDTLVLDSLINYKNATIDIYYCRNQFHIPYHLPTGGIYKDSIKEKECDMSKYPNNVKCYAYDEKNRVKEMSVDGSGTMGTWRYEYDSLDRIRNIEWLGRYYAITYNNLGLVKELSEGDGVIKKSFQFSYR